MAGAIEPRGKGAVGGPFIFFCLILVWSPLPLASNRPIIWAVNALLVAALLVWTALWQRRRLGNRSAPPIAIRFAAGAFCLTVAWLAIQALPFAPADLAHPAWNDAQAVLNTPLSASISVTPGQTLTMLLRFATYGAFFWCGLQLTRSWHRARLLVQVIFAMTIVYATYGLVLDALQSSTILWFDKWVYRDALTSTFVNRNAFAAFSGAGCLAGLALLFERLRNASGGVSGNRTKTFTLVSSELFSTSGLIILGVLVLFIALILTGSRAGLLATLLGIALFVGLVASRRAGGCVVAGLGLLVVAALATALVLSGDFFALRLFGTGQAWDIRQNLFDGTLKAIADRPWLGYGGGSFADVFGLYAPEELGTQFQFRRAHNTYLELALELGVPVATVLIAGFLALGAGLLQGVRQRRERFWLPALALGAGAVFAAHSLVDFPLQIQANALVFLALLAAGIAQSGKRAGGASSAPSATDFQQM